MICVPKLIVIILMCISPTQCLNELKNGNNLVNTSKCTIPDIPPFSAALNFRRKASVQCSNFNPLLSYTTVQNGTNKLYIRKDAVLMHFGTLDSIKCCYSYVYRNGTEGFPDEGVVVSDCSEFQFELELKHDLVWVSCLRSDDHQPTVRGFPLYTALYENIHQIISVSDNVTQKAKILKESTPKRPISVLMIVIDSVSRLNFIRTMPLTRNCLLSNNFFEFKGYNKVDDNTFPNAMAFLAGLNYTDSIEICKPTEVDGLINCPFIWYKYRNLGYATAYAEDWSQIATFNYYKKGFKDSPTDYYFKPYMDATNYLKIEYQDTMPFCTGPETQGDRILNLAYDFATKLKGLPSFGVFWMNTFSHNEISTPMSMDGNVRFLFEKLKESQVMDESIIILLSDHGVRFGEIMNTTRGFYEVRLPMHYISLPNWFKEEYPTETKNLGENTRMLTSNYDLYMTLQHILKMSGTNYTVTPSLACPHCRSFFEAIPNERSCSEAGIPEKWCTCNVDTTTRTNIN